MAEEIKTASRKPRRWLRWVGFFFVCMFLGLIIMYFVGTSEWALKSVILPKVSKAMNADVTVESANISPFSSVNLRGLKVQTKGSDPLVTAKEVRARYSLTDIIKGNINVSEVTLESPTVNLITFADGTSNLDPITKGAKEAKPREKKEPKGKKNEQPPQLNLQKFALNNATVRKVAQRKDGTQQVLQLSGVAVTAADLANNKTGKLTLAADVNLNQGWNSASNGVLVAKVAGSFDVALDAALKPTVAKGQTKLDVTQAQGAFAQANALGVVLNTDVTPTQLNDVSVRLTQGGKSLGAITASGPFNAETMEGKIAVAISQIDKQALNLVGGAMGIDFNQTTINSTNTIELTQKGRVVSVNGALLVGSFGVTQRGQTTPTMDIRSAYAVTMDQTNKTAMLHNFTLNGTQGATEFLRGALAKPMLLDLGKSSNAVDESAFDLVVTNFNLVDWKAFLGTNVDLASGTVSLNLNLLSKQAGKQLAFKTDLHVANVVVNDPSLPKTPLALDVSADAAIAGGKVFDLNAVKIALTKTERANNELNIAGRIDLTKSNAWAGNVKVTSDGLDLTTYYDLFSKKDTNATQTAKTGGGGGARPKEAKPETEPAAMQLPFANLVTEVGIAKLFLREIAISNLTTKTTIEQGRVNLNPFSLTLNGAPMSLAALVNVGVPGYEYDVNVKLDHVPIEPLANTFVPEQRGIYKGAIVSGVTLKGAGITGPNVRKNLGGAIGFTLTNAEVHYTDVRFQNRYLGWLVKWGPSVAKYLQVPELTQSPISLVDIKCEITNGTTLLQRTFVESPAFQATIPPGTITLNDVITNSTLNKLPLQLNLRRSIAEKARLAPPGGQAPYVDLPSFVTIEGTIGQPQNDVNEKAVLQLIAKVASGFIKGDVGKFLQGFGGGTNQPAGSTNAAPATNSVGNLLQSLPGLFDKQPKPPRTNAPPNPRRRQQ